MNNYYFGILSRNFVGYKDLTAEFAEPAEDNLFFKTIQFSALSANSAVNCIVLKVVNYSFYTIFQHVNIKVDEEPELAAGELEIGKNLCFMDRINSFY